MESLTTSPRSGVTSHSRPSELENSMSTAPRRLVDWLVCNVQFSDDLLSRSDSIVKCGDGKAIFEKFLRIIISSVARGVERLRGCVGY